MFSSADSDEAKAFFAAASASNVICAHTLDASLEAANDLGAPAVVLFKKVRHKHGGVTIMLVGKALVGAIGVVLFGLVVFGLIVF